MSKPKNAIDVGGKRLYHWPSEPPYELECPSVTTILGRGMPKPALVGWAGRTVAEYAVDNKEVWEKLDRQAAIDLLKGAPRRYADKKLNIGTIIHDALDSGGDVKAEHVGYLGAAELFLHEMEPEILAQERTVYSRKHHYAGTVDAFISIEGVPGILDWKTGKDVYPDFGVQVAAYAMADFADVGGEETPFVRPEYAYVVCLKPDGRYKAVKFTPLEPLFEVFLACQKIYEWNRDGGGKR